MGLWVDTTGMGLDDLMRKEIELRKKLSTVVRIGVSAEIINQLQNMIDDVRLAIMEVNATKKDDPDENFNDYLNIG